ncbi:O-antigen polysaccharide polymerase Wzy [Bacteroides nordii]|uniref:O-antigen polysaccharide polymerase Wzy n=1 Tax=Bacteroides nordii TaxID=291645 RepID=UPI003521BC40
MHKKKIRVLLVLLTLTFGILCYSELVSNIDFEILRVMGLLGTIQLFYSVWSWKSIGREIINPYVFFLLALYLFSFGQSFLYIFNIVSEKRDLLGFQGITIDEIFNAQKMTLFMLSFFHIGAICFVRNKKELLNTSYNNINYIYRIRKLGWFLFVVSIIPYYWDLIETLLISMASGYGAIYERNAAIGISQIDKYIADYFIPSLICLFVGYSNDKRVKSLVIGICTVNIVAILLTGGRTPAVILVALLILLYHYCVKKISFKGILVLSIFSFLFLSLLSVVSYLRSQEERSIEAYLRYDVSGNNAAVDALAEMGGTMFCLIKTKDIVPLYENYRYGRSYLYSFTTFIPNIGFWEIHPAKREANLGEWLTNALRLSYGTGYSMCAEAYINFGGCCWIIMFFLGGLFGNLLGIENKRLKEDLALLIFSLIIFWFCLKITRNSFIGFVRIFFYYALPAYYIIKKGLPFKK